MGNLVKGNSEGIHLGGSNNIVCENVIQDNDLAIYKKGGHPKIYHNNFINNSKQLNPWYSSAMDNGYPSGGNFWSDYVGVDLYSGERQNEPGSDGIGDTPHVIQVEKIDNVPDEDHIDNYPLMNPWNGSSCVETDGNMRTYEFDFSYGYGYYIVVVSTNSTFEDLSIDQNQISFLVTGPTGTIGVAKIIIPEDLTGSNFTIYLNDLMLLENSDYTKTYNGTHTIIDITYSHSTHLLEITGTNIIPEFPSWVILPLLFAASLAAIIYRKRLHRKPNQQTY